MGRFSDKEDQGLDPDIREVYPSFEDKEEMTTKHKNKTVKKEPKLRCGLCGKTKN
jgi:hypothetical protein